MASVAIVGGGEAGSEAARAAVESGGRVTLFESENDIPLPRSGWHLLLSGDARQVSGLPKVPFKLGGIDLRLSEPVASVANDCGVRTNRGVERFDAVVVSTGVCAFPSGPSASKKRGVHVLARRQDFEELGRGAREIQVAVLCGSGLSALRAADQLSSLGVALTMLDPAWGATSRLNPVIFEVLQRAASERGIRIVPARMQRVVGVGSVEGAVVEGEVLPCQAVISIPDCFPRLPGLRVELGSSGGVLVDMKARSSAPRIYAAGGCSEVSLGAPAARALHPAGKSVGRAAGSNAAGGELSLIPVGAFAETLFGIEVAWAGLSYSEALASGMDAEEVVLRLPGPSACSIVFERGSTRVQGIQLAGSEVSRFSETLPIIVSQQLNLRDISRIEKAGSSDISPVSDTAREGLRRRS